MKIFAAIISQVFKVNIIAAVLKYIDNHSKLITNS